MHAGEAKTSKGQRAHGGIFYAPSGEIITPTGIRDEKCTPVRRATAATSGHTETLFYSPSGETIMPAGIRDEKYTPAR